MTEVSYRLQKKWVIPLSLKEPQHHNLAFLNLKNKAGTLRSTLGCFSKE
jgi:hypothetical protein